MDIQAAEISSILKTQIQNFGSDAVVTESHLEPERLVGLDGVHALALEVVRLELVDQPDAAPLLSEAKQNARAFSPHLCQRPAQLRPAIAFQ